ncbi:hypothetical protein [Halovivax cerinus]|uniref:Transcriptional regulator n=1 Tax=Halovivax cerinus TaxID=1487865 RepID=A0ABD5NPF5_9EURY|nr:hypothetical protein [Halovivax cerinus]
MSSIAERFSTSVAHMKDENPDEPENSDPSTAINPHLGGKDIRFLQAIQTVNERAGYKSGTDERPPATTGKIASAADLNKNEVNYRLNQRGFDTNGLGYIRVYGSELLPNGALSAKCAELTEAGEEALSEVLEGPSPNAVDTNADFEGRLAELETEIEAIREETETIREALPRSGGDESDPLGADRSEEFDAVLNAMVAYQRIFSTVLEIDVSDFQGDNTLSEGTISKNRKRVREAVRT